MHSPAYNTNNPGLDPTSPCISPSPPPPACSCYAACSELNTKRVVYTPSDDGAKCIPSCPAGQVVASTTDDGVVCAR